MYYEKENVMLVSYEGSRKLVLYIQVTYFLRNPENRYKLVKGSTISLVMPYPLTLFIHSNYLEKGLILIFLYKFIF